VKPSHLTCTAFAAEGATYLLRTCEVAAGGRKVIALAWRLNRWANSSGIALRSLHEEEDTIRRCVQYTLRAPSGFLCMDGLGSEDTCIV